MAFYTEWGWADFLATMAETNLFTIVGSGVDAIECVKTALAFKVLTYASLQKDKNLAMNEAYKT